MDFKHLKVKKLSTQAMSKARRGLPVRLMEGTGTQICVLPHQFDAISRSFLKKKGINVTLTPPEIEQNQAIEGSGIFGKKADKWMEKKGVKKLVYKVGSIAKPFAEEAINMGAAYATTMGVPSSITDLAKNTATGYMNDPEAYQTKKGQAKLMKQVGKVALDTASPYLSDAGFDVNKVRAAGKAAADMKRASRSAPSYDSGFDMRASRSAPSYDSGFDLRGQSEDAFMSQLQGFMDQRAARKAPPPTPSTNPYDYMDQDGIVGNGLGYGLYAGGRGFPMRAWDRSKRYVHQGTSLIGGRGIQALESQPLAENWQFKYTLPPAFQRR